MAYCEALAILDENGILFRIKVLGNIGKRIRAGTHDSQKMCKTCTKTCANILESAFY